MSHSSIDLNQGAALSYSHNLIPEKGKCQLRLRPRYFSILCQFGLGIYFSFRNKEISNLRMSFILVK